MKEVEPRARPYQQRVRADATARTRLAILGAAQSVAASKPLAAITLKDVAEHAGVTVQTVLRRFGSRDELIEAAIDHFATQVRQERSVPRGDVRAAVDNVVAHYELWGDPMLLLLGQETIDPLALRITTLGRELHDRWVTDSLAPGTPTQHHLLVVATDLYTWKLLRRDRGLSASDTAEHMHALCRAILDGSGRTNNG